MDAADTAFFPAGAVKAAGWYSRTLQSMTEHLLYQQSTNKTVEQYRFLWLRTFHKPIAVRIWKDSAGITLRVIRLSGTGGNDPGKIERDESFALTADQWKGFLKLLEKSSFWASPVTDRSWRYRDGSVWVLEGQAGGNYHVLDHQSLTPDDGRHLEDFVLCCRYVLSLSKEHVPKNEDY
ncbi:MAG: hypothetical protein QOF48_351 [Verrucomicrobiota bacterium]